MFADSLAMCGDTWDTTLNTGLSGLTFFPLVAVTSIAIPDKYYWAKILSLKGSVSFRGIQFSSDGSILIAHSGF